MNTCSSEPEVFLLSLILIQDGTRVPVCAHPPLQSYIEPFLALAEQTLESFVSSLNPVKMDKEDSSCQEHQFVLAVAGIITSECGTGLRGWGIASAVGAGCTYSLIWVMVRRQNPVSQTPGFLLVLMV